MSRDVATQESEEAFKVSKTSHNSRTKNGDSIVTGRFPYADSAKLMFPTQPPKGFRVLTQDFQIMTALNISLFVHTCTIHVASKIIMVDGFSVCMASEVYQKYSTTTTSKQRVTEDMQDVLVLSTRLDTHARRLGSLNTS